MDRRDPFRYSLLVATAGARGRGKLEDLLSRVPVIVSMVYREHVEGWNTYQQLTGDRRRAWHAATKWLRELEKEEDHRLFPTSPRLDASWWAAHVRAVASRRAGGPRLVLPLEEDIDYCVAILQPHVLAWVMALVHERFLELGMFPKSLLMKAFRALRDAHDEEFAAVAQQCQQIYAIKHRITREHFQSAFFPYVLSHWPGLRLCPPFFSDLSTVQPPPFEDRPRDGRYMFVHATETSYAQASQRDASTCTMDEVSIQAKPHEGPIGIRVTADNGPAVLEALRLLDGVHPRSFSPMSPRSPYARAAQLLEDCCTTTSADTNFISLPENALDGCEMGFAFTFMKPRGIPGETLAWEKDEEFYEVKATISDQEHTFYISSYTGFGLRIRHTVLSIEKACAIKGTGVCVVIPGGLNASVQENVMLTTVGWLRDLGLTKVDIVTEAMCHAMNLGAISSVVGENSQKASVWASVHDGALTCQVLGIMVATNQGVPGDGAAGNGRRVKDLWQGRYSAKPLKVVLIEQLRDYLLGHNRIRKTMNDVANNSSSRFVGRALVIDAIKHQIPNVVETLETVFACDSGCTETSYAFEVPGASIAPVVIEFSKDLYDGWIDQCIARLTQEPWWEELKERLNGCRGVVVSGGLFDACPKAALDALQDKLAGKARERTKLNRLHMLHGACLEVYKRMGCRELVVSSSAGDTKDRLQILEF